MKCSICREDKSLDNFYYDSYNKAWQKRCKACKNVKLLSEESYKKLLLEQDGVCAICNLPNNTVTKKGAFFKLSIDHDHSTGEVRGLLCHSCNTGLGKFKDSPVLLSQAISYLSRRV